VFGITELQNAVDVIRANETSLLFHDNQPTLETTTGVVTD